LLWMVEVVWLKLRQRLLVLRLWPRKLSRVWEVRVKLGVGQRGREVMGICLAGDRLRAWVDDDDMALFEMLDESMKILEVETAASVISALRSIT
jgi:hypothetical protein